MKSSVREMRARSSPIRIESSRASLYGKGSANTSVAEPDESSLAMTDAMDYAFFE